MASRKPNTGVAAHRAPPAMRRSPPPLHADRSRALLDGQSTILQLVAGRAPLPDVRRSPPLAHADRSRALLDGQSTILQLVAGGAPLPDVLSGVARLVEQHAPAA